MKRILLIILSLVFVIVKIHSQELPENNLVTIMGHIIDDQKESVSFASVRVEGTGTGTLSDINGNYKFSCASSDSMVVIFSMVGYETRKRILRNPTDTVRLNVMIPNVGFNINEVQVTEIRSQTSSMTDISLDDFRHLGNASGNSVEQIIATQSGVSTHNELSYQYNVRGGSFDENSVYLNGIEVYRPLLIRAGQQEGLSIINPDMVHSIGFSAGGFEPRYGDKMSSVLSIEYKKVNKTEGSISASLLGGSAYLGIGNNKYSWTNAIRYKTTSYLLGTLDTKGEYEPKDIDYQTYFSWMPSKRFTLDIIGNISNNDYKFTPSDRKTTFGTSEIVKEFKVYFDGQEQDNFKTLFGSAAATYKFNENNELTFNISAFKTQEKETFDISGEYWLSTQEYETALGIGKYMEHARNSLDASVINFGLTGRSRTKDHDIRYGILLKKEKVEEKMREWEMRDSVGYSLPHSSNDLSLIYNLVSVNQINTTRMESFIQDKWIKEFDEGMMILNYGLRVSNWSWNKEWLVSPRATVAFIPSKNDNFTFRFSTGIYYQAPFYKELKDTLTVNGNTIVQLNKNIKSQKSIHFVLGGEYKFKINDRPFKATAEIYFKSLSNLIPYNVDNVRVVYYGSNMADGYAAGLDLKIYGEFVPGTDSWVSIGIMKTEEKINGIKVPRPTDQRLNASIFFSDYFPGTDKWKMTLRGHYAGGLPFGPPHTGRENQFFRMKSYRRVDIGLSYRLLNNENKHIKSGLGRAFKNIWLGIDAFNVLGISNVNSYYWVTDITNHQFAVPNYLTGRQINARILLEF